MWTKLSTGASSAQDHPAVQVRVKMDEVGLLPARTSSKRIKSPTSSRDVPRRGDRERTSKTSQTSPSSTPRIARPSPSARTASAPQVLSLTDSNKFSPVGNESDAYGEERDSLAPVKDDPFFRNYHTPHSVSLAREQRVAKYSESVRDEEIPKEPPSRSPRRPSEDTPVQLPVGITLSRRGDRANYSLNQPQSRSGMADINIAVIGSSGVGKSTLIQRALGLPTLPASSASSQRMPVENIAYTVSLIELDLESFDIVPDRTIHWPKQINGQIVPRLDGALLLYDVMNRESISELPQTLSESR